MVSTVSVQEIECKSALHRLKRKMPYSWDLNLYQGCQHGCIYCYAQDSWIHRKEGCFSEKVNVKINVAEVLETELSSPSWKREIINIGGVTDSYQPLEENYQLMRKVLKLCIQYQTPVIISTKSNLILRDIDLLARLAEITYVNVACTVTTMDENVRTVIEPGAATSEDRFTALGEFAQTKASRGLHVMPIIPYLTDTDVNFEELFKLASQNQVSYALCGTLYLRGIVKTAFFQKLKDRFPNESEKLNTLYQKGSASKEYKNSLYEKVNYWRNEYQLSGNYSRYIHERLGK